jgi:hypothetical protein
MSSSASSNVERAENVPPEIQSHPIEPLVMQPVMQGVSTRAQQAYDELKSAMSSFVSIVNDISDPLPKYFMDAIRPVRGCVRSLENVLPAGGESLKETLSFLDKFLAEVQRACKTLAKEHAGTLAATLERALYDLWGALDALMYAAERET